MDPHLFEVFMDVQAGLPRQGPGDDDSTRRALALCKGLPPQPDVLDVGCGPGRQTVVLAEQLGGQVIAVDRHAPYLDELQRLAAGREVAAHISTRVGDMAALPFPDRSFDLVWSEGAAYIMGFGAAMAAWRRLLRPGGYVAATELVWLVPDPPTKVAAFFGQEYPAMGSVEDARDHVRAGGYQLVGDLVLPDLAWWQHYYTPLSAKLPNMRLKYAADPAALEVIEMTAAEIDMRRRFGHTYGYVFVVGRAV